MIAAHPSIIVIASLPSDVECIEIQVRIAFSSMSCKRDVELIQLKPPHFKLAAF
jgi:hypothetical protein